MEELPTWVRAFLDSRPPWNYVLGAVALGIFLAPKLMELHANWRDFRMGRRDLDLEERRLALLKLRYDIEVLRKQHDLPDLSGVPLGAPAVAAVALAPAPPIQPAAVQPVAAGGPPETSIPVWVPSSPLIRGPLLLSLQVGLGLLATGLSGLLIFLFVVAVSPGAAEGETLAAGPRMMIVLFALLPLVIARATFAAFVRVGRWRKALAAAGSQIGHSRP